MKALSIEPYYAMQIFAKAKDIEVRTWKTDYRGDVLICSTNKREVNTIPGHALCVATLSDIVPLERKHLKRAMLPGNFDTSGKYAWILTNLRYIVPFAVKGRLSLWECDHEIEFVDEDCPTDYWDALFV